MKKSTVAVLIVFIIMGTLSFGGGESGNPFNRVLDKLDSMASEIEDIKELLSQEDEDSITEVTSNDYYFEEWQLWIDPEEVYGDWEVVSFVNKPIDFDPSSESNDFYLKQLNFSEEEVEFISNTTEGQGFNMPWQDNAIIHPGGDRTISRFLIKDINNETYMFYEWKSGGYLLKDQMPKYYVLKKVMND